MTEPRVEVLPIEDGATTDPNNVNKHTAKGGKLLENSLQKRGAFRSIASAGKGVDVPVTYAGNYTLEKAVEAGFKEIVNVHVRGDQLVNVVRDDIEPGSAEAIALGLEDNESAAKSYNPDIDILAALAAGDNAILSKLREEDKTFNGMLEGMGLKDETQDAEPQIDRAAELLEKWQVKTGDLWKIGEHRLLVGDSTKREDVERVMGGEKAVCMWTDPPYGVEYVGKTKDALTIENDGADNLLELLTIAFREADKILSNGASLYIAAPPGRQSHDFSSAILATPEWLWHETLVWVKDSMVLGHSDYHYRHEIIYYGWRGSNRNWYAGRDQTTVFEIPRPKASIEHPTMKPPELVEKCLSNSTKRDDIVYEPFAGSGTTLVACQNLGRKCRAIEISPAYCAVILERMSTAFPGIEIEKI
jgi:site-specific DNA-methyltransferase (adenine-specific)